MSPKFSNDCVWVAQTLVNAGCNCDQWTQPIDIRNLIAAVAAAKHSVATLVI
jgi:hypothetical protein